MLELDLPPETKIITERGEELLVDVLKRSSSKHLWSVKWESENTPHGISFHCTYKHALKFIARAYGAYARRLSESLPTDKPRLVKVSSWLYDWVEEYGDFWAEFNDIELAETYDGPTLN